MDGIVVIDKPAGYSSHDVVSEVKKILGVRKAGHTGTLDPLATGVLPVCVGEATKLAQFLTAQRKTYLATMLLGVETDTQDTEGQVTETSDRQAPEEDIRQALGRLVGRIRQVPPAYSALKYKGKPLYRYARAGEFPEIAAREVEIFALDVKSIVYPYVTFEISCSKGTYIRTVCLDAGRMLGCGACLAGLRRLRSGSFTEEMAVALEKKPSTAQKEDLVARLLPMARLLPDMPAIEIDEALAGRIRAGVQPDAGTLRKNVLPFLAAGDVIKFILPDGDLVAVAEMLMPADALAGQDDKAQAARILRVLKRTTQNN
ncbi:MAG: tRNA pseudouridine(55) synthase TruB [Smithellaceae bacterium]|nr:tRNA pseudouridine(55) synthase TruB [Syntrophaceae bacterium]MDD4241638.1 tRNA pseudouridine(55) synthase TruB [Smithellaceae bacterium]NLX52273.1 tRNA pseudouridine(55) synthase TruB [Deltaproteobacteria bacterium]